MEKYRVLCGDIIEHISETLSKDMAISLLLGQLRELGWTQGGANPAAST